MERKFEPTATLQEVYETGSTRGCCLEGGSTVAPVSAHLKGQGEEVDMAMEGGESGTGRGTHSFKQDKLGKCVNIQFLLWDHVIVYDYIILYYIYIL